MDHTELRSKMYEQAVFIHGTTNIRFICDDCPLKEECDIAYDLYNVYEIGHPQGQCLAEK